MGRTKKMNMALFKVSNAAKLLHILKNRIINDRNIRKHYYEEAKSGQTSSKQLLPIAG